MSELVPDSMSTKGLEAFLLRHHQIRDDQIDRFFIFQNNVQSFLSAVRGQHLVTECRKHGLSHRQHQVLVIHHQNSLGAVQIVQLDTVILDHPFFRRQIYAHGSARPGLAGNGHAAAMICHDAVNPGEPEPAMFPAFGSEKRFKNSW